MARKPLPMIVKQLKSWRQKNGLSRRAAAEVMEARGYVVPISTLRKWEVGDRRPGRLTTQALKIFLQQHPTIPNPPVYRPGPKRRTQDQ